MKLRIVNRLRFSYEKVNISTNACRYCNPWVALLLPSRLIEVPGIRCKCAMR